VLVSPLIAAGTVFRVAPGAMPLDHTSVLKTIETRWSLPALTARDAAAGDVGAVLTLTTPRTDDPLLGVVVPVATGPQPDEEQPSHLQQVQAELVSRLPVPDEKGGTHHLMPTLRTSSEYQAYIIARTNAWKASKGRQASAAREGVES
jgi:phospholipase C